MYSAFLLVTLLATAHSFSFDPTVDWSCASDGISIAIQTVGHSFRGRLAPLENRRGAIGDKCAFYGSGNEWTNFTIVRRMWPACAIKVVKQKQHETSSLSSYSMEFVIHEHPILILGQDRHLRIECSVQTQNALLHKLIEQPLPKIVESEPIFSLELRRELSGIFSAPVQDAVFGAPYFLVGRVRRFSSTRVRIHSCYALSTGASEAEGIRLVDNRGCPMDRRLLGEFSLDRHKLGDAATSAVDDLTLASRLPSMFRFEGSKFVMLECSAELMSDLPSCGRAKRELLHSVSNSSRLHDPTTHGRNYTDNKLSTATVTKEEANVLPDSLADENGHFDGSGEADVEVIEKITLLEREDNAGGGGGDSQATTHLLVDETTSSPNFLRPTVVVLVEKVRTASVFTANGGKTLTARLIVRVTDAAGSEKPAGLPTVMVHDVGNEQGVLKANESDEGAAVSDSAIYVRNTSATILLQPTMNASEQEEEEEEPASSESLSAVDALLLAALLPNGATPYDSHRCVAASELMALYRLCAFGGMLLILCAVVTLVMCCRHCYARSRNRLRKQLSASPANGNDIYDARRRHQYRKASTRMTTVSNGSITAASPKKDNKYEYWIRDYAKPMTAVNEKDSTVYNGVDYDMNGGYCATPIGEMNSADASNRVSVHSYASVKQRNGASAVRSILDPLALAGGGTAKQNANGGGESYYGTGTFGRRGYGASNRNANDGGVSLHCQRVSPPSAPPPVSTFGGVSQPTNDDDASRLMKLSMITTATTLSNGGGYFDESAGGDGNALLTVRSTTSSDEGQTSSADGHTSASALMMKEYNGSRYYCEGNTAAVESDDDDRQPLPPPPPPPPPLRLSELSRRDEMDGSGTSSTVPLTAVSATLTSFFADDNSTIRSSSNNNYIDRSVMSTMRADPEGGYPPYDTGDPNAEDMERSSSSCCANSNSCSSSSGYGGDLSTLSATAAYKNPLMSTFGAQRTVDETLNDYQKQAIYYGGNGSISITFHQQQQQPNLHLQRSQPPKTTYSHPQQNGIQQAYSIL